MLPRVVVALLCAASLGAQKPSFRIVVLSGEDAVNIIQQKTAVAPVVEVRDSNDLPVAGVPVTFTVTGGNTAAFAGGAQTLTVTTNAAGRAIASGLTPLGNGAVQINVTAAVQGQAISTTITQTNFATAAQAAAAGPQAQPAGGGGGGGFPTGWVVGLGAVATGGVVGYQLYEKYGPSSGSDCSGSIEGPGAFQTQIPAAGGTFSVTVTESCAFRVTADVPWITFSVSSSQVFEPQTLTFTYTAAPNPGPARSGIISIEFADGTGGSGFGVTQLAGSAGLFVVASPIRIAVAAGVACGPALEVGNVSGVIEQVEPSVIHAQLTADVKELRSCDEPALVSPDERFAVDSASLTGGRVAIRFRSLRPSPLLAVLFDGNIADDGRTIAGSLRWVHGLTGDEVVTPVMFSRRR